MSMPPEPVAGIRAIGLLKQIDVRWDPTPWQTVLDHYRVYGRRVTSGPTSGPAELLDKTPYPHFEHVGLAAAGETWAYHVVVVDAAGATSEPSPWTRASSTTSVTVSGTPVAVVGAYDGKGLEFALSPNGYADYPATFPADVDYRFGVDSPGTSWSYLQPGPADAWAGRTHHTFELRFELPSAPTDDLDLALWLIDSHATIPGSAVLSLNGTVVERLRFAGGGTRGSLEGDSTIPGSPLKPSYVERPLPAELFRAGENVLSLHKDDGSWIAYDAIGVFAR